MPLESDGFGRFPGRDLAAAHAPGKLDDFCPASARVAGAGEPDAHARLAVDGVAGDAPTGLARHQGLQRPHCAVPGHRHPEGHVRLDQTNQAARLRPGDIPGIEGLAHGGEPLHADHDVGQALKLARGEPQALARVVP